MAQCRRTTPLVWLVAAVSVECLGCDSCERSRPYTPFRVDASAAASAPPPPSAVAAAASAGPAAIPAEPIESRKLEPPSGRFTVGGRQIELPKELAAERLLERVVGSNAAADAFAWVTPAKADAEWNGPMGELWHFPIAADAKKLLELPAWVPSGPGCRLESRLALLGKATLLVDVQAKCDRSLPQRTATRAMVFMALDPVPAILLGLRIAEAAADESIQLTPTTADRDGDGREDPYCQVDLTVSSTQIRATAGLGWLDRAAGASLDAGSLAQSLESTLVGWEAGLQKKSQHQAILSETAALRRLLANICQQSAVPRILDWRGETIACPNMTQLATRLGRIEVRAALGMSDPLTATHAVAYANGWLGGIAAVEREELQRRIVKTMVPVNVGLATPVSVRPMAATDSIRYSPLRFGADGTVLFVQSAPATTERVDLDGNTVADDADASVAPWPVGVTAADGRTWHSVVPACDRSELALAIKGADGAFLPLVPTHLLAPRPGVCRSPAAWPVSVAPIAWQGDSPLALIDGACWSGTNAQPCPSPAKMGTVMPGSPRSPDGRRLIAVTVLGPIVLGGPKPELWKGAGLDGKRLSDCVVANDAAAIACIANGAVQLFRRPGAGPSN